MGLQSVQFEYEVHCDWAVTPPVYRLYVNDELFTERTYIWNNSYLEEAVSIEALPGDYVVRYELYGNGTLTAKNPRVTIGSAEFIDNNTLRIQHASS
jgi:hypothetical protein